MRLLLVVEGKQDFILSHHNTFQDHASIMFHM